MYALATRTYFISGATLLPIARRTVRFRRPVLHVQVGNRREKTFGQQAGLLRACESHAVRSAQGVHVRYPHTVVRMVRTVCAPLVHDLCACQPSPLICHTLLFAASSLRRSLQGKTRDVGLCAEPSGNRRRTLYRHRGLWLTPTCVRHLADTHVALLTSARSC